MSENHNVSLLTKIENSSIYKNKVELYNIPIKRKISIISDLISSIIFLKNLLKIKPDRMISLTPKTIIFGIFAKIFRPNIYRIHIYTGLPWTNMIGYKRKFFIFLERLNIFFTDKIIIDSQAQIDYLNENNLDTNKFYLINNGSIKGVDCNNFYKFNQNKKDFLKKKYQIPSNVKVISYIGRMDPDKGIYELINSFIKIKLKIDNIFLLLVGIDEININSYISKIEKKISQNIIFINHVSNPEEIFNISDIYCLPSKREGFGNAVIESSACEVPVVGSDIFGLKSSLINEMNGLTFKVNDINDLVLKLTKLLEDKNLCKKLGKNGREYVLRNFERKDVFDSIMNLILT